MRDYLKDYTCLQCGRVGRFDIRTERPEHCPTCKDCVPPIEERSAYRRGLRAELATYHKKGSQYGVVWTLAKYLFLLERENAELRAEVASHDDSIDALWSAHYETD